MGQQSLTQPYIAQRRMIADSKARNAVALVPASQNHVGDYHSAEAGRIISIFTGVHTTAQLDGEITRERLRMKEAHGVEVGRDSVEEIPQGRGNSCLNSTHTYFPHPTQYT